MIQQTYYERKHLLILMTDIIMKVAISHLPDLTSFKI